MNIEQQVTIRLKANPDKPISLKSELEKCSETIDATKSLNLGVVLEDGVFAEIVDDLIYMNIFDCNLKIELNEKSTCKFSAKFLCPKLTQQTCEQSRLPENCPVIKRSLRLEHNGENSESSAKICFAGKHGRSLDFKAIQAHKASDTTSNLSIKSVLSDGSIFLCNTMIEIDEQIENTNSLQENKNLLIGTPRRIKTSPNLEISANKVKCMHGSATGKIDSEHLFYMASRGINKPESELMIIGAFLN
jgi:hypothetical protein